MVFTPNPVNDATANFAVVDQGANDPGPPLSDNIVFLLRSGPDWAEAMSFSNGKTSLGVSLSCTSPENSTVPVNLNLASGNATLRFDAIRSGGTGSPVIMLTNYSLV